MKNQFTEQQTESYYDAEDALYRSFWDGEGSLHWGFFDQSTRNDFLKACANLNNIMVGKARIGQNSKVLDFGCGNGTTSMWLCKHLGCDVVGVDLSGVRIDNAKNTLEKEPDSVRARLAFEKGSVTALPFGGGAFTHVWSQATMYHVHDKEKALSEAYRVLGDGGIFVFDDLTKPKADISDAARTYVYDRLLFDTDFSFESYQDALKKAGFQVLDAQDISPHLKTSYECLERIALGENSENAEKYRALAKAYGQTVQAVEKDELGWGLYVCQK